MAYCWKCGAELPSDINDCPQCGARHSERVPLPPNADGELRALREIYDHYGSQRVLGNPILLSNAIGDILGEDGKKLRNQLRIAMDAGLGKLYLAQLTTPSPDFHDRCLIELQNAGLSDVTAKHLIDSLDAMVGFASAPKTTLPLSAPEDFTRKTGDNNTSEGGISVGTGTSAGESSNGNDNKFSGEDARRPTEHRKPPVALMIIVVIIAIFVVSQLMSPSHNSSPNASNRGSFASTVTSKATGTAGKAQGTIKPAFQQISRTTLSAGGSHTVGLKEDGTVIAVGNNYDGQCNVSNWTNIVAVSAGWKHTVGLKEDGTVVAVGDNSEDQCDVSDWTNIVAISAGWTHTVGLKKDGTIVSVGGNAVGNDNECDVSGWTDIIAIAAGNDRTLGLKKDGTVVADSWTSRALEGLAHQSRWDVSSWTDIVAITADDEVMGVRADGTVVAVGTKGDESNVSSWRNMVTVSTGFEHTVGLKSDGTVVALGDNDPYGQCNVSGWKNIVAISAGNNHTVGLKADGTVVAVGSNYEGQCDVSDWHDIRVP